MRWVDLIVYGSLALLGLATVWIIFRAVTGRGAWWALKGLLIVGLLVGLVFGGVFSWFLYMGRVPGHITPELVREAHAHRLDAMRRLAGERNLEELAVADYGEEIEAFRALAMHPDLLMAEIILGSGKGVTLYWLPFQREGYVSFDLGTKVDDSPPRLTRGLIGCDRWFSTIRTFEYSEPAMDRSGNAVRLKLTLLSDGLERS